MHACHSATRARRSTLRTTTSPIAYGVSGSCARCTTPTRRAHRSSELPSPRTSPLAPIDEHLLVIALEQFGDHRPPPAPNRYAANRPSAGRTSSPAVLTRGRRSCHSSREVSATRSPGVRSSRARRPGAGDRERMGAGGKRRAMIVREMGPRGQWTRCLSGSFARGGDILREASRCLERSAELRGFVTDVRCWQTTHATRREQGRWAAEAAPSAGERARPRHEPQVGAQDRNSGDGTALQIGDRSVWPARARYPPLRAARE